MNDNRRDFLRKATLGSVLTSIGGIPFLQASPVSGKDEKGTHGPEIVFPGWDVHFDEATSFLSLTNGSVSVSGKLGFVSCSEKWTITTSRDGVPRRYALVDLQANVQGYIVFIPQANRVQILFYHRTAQSYPGILSFDGKAAFLPDSFACKTRPQKGERVLSLGTGRADSLLNDSLFAPESDTLLQMDASTLRVATLGAGSYAFAMAGVIGESSEAVFTIKLENGYFKNRYVPYYHAINRERCPKAPTGWMSWNTYFDQATAEDNLAEARIGKKFLQPFGCEFWSIESWQGNSPHLPVRDFYNMDLEVDKNKFPKGMKQLADDIRKLGFRPGLWMAPFGTGNKEFYEAHRNWFLHDESGKPVSSWNGRYTLDPTVPEAREHLKKIHRIASREWGYEFFKIDGMSGRSHGYCAHLYERPEIRSRFHDRSCPNPFEQCIKAFREGIGEDRVFLACQGHTSGPEPLYADASRIGADIVHPNETVKWANVLNQGRCTINQVFTHNIVLINDPDTLLVGDLPLEEARVSATIVALPGQLTFFGDKLAGLPDQRMKMLQQSLPVADVRPMSLYPHFSMLPVWNLAVKNEFLGSYNVVALFNWDDEPAQLSFTAGELGIDPDPEYVLYEFWTEKSAGIMKGSFGMKLSPHTVRLLVVHRLQAVPQWIGSDRHIVQNATELEACRWNDPARSLEGSIRLTGSFPLTARFHVPDGYAFRNASCEGATCSATREPGNVLAVTFSTEETGTCRFNIGF
ncbi:MAG: alpha-galactosidase [Mangrovibacterium sp.]